MTKIDDLKDGDFAYSPEDNLVIFKIPEGAQLIQGSQSVLGNYPNSDPHTVTFAYTTFN